MMLPHHCHILTRRTTFITMKMASMLQQTLSHVLDVSSTFRHGGLACPSVQAKFFSSLLSRHDVSLKLSRTLASSLS